VLELLQILKSQHGLGGPSLPTYQAVPIKKGQVSGVPAASSKIILKAISIKCNVNAIPDGSNLPLGHKGLTVVYGENGSGKSGYARVLKRACNARDRKERILPNVFTQAVASPAKASFKLSIDGGDDKPVDWTDGQDVDPALSNICVFDEKCARIIVDDNNEMTYLPYGADIFGNLVIFLKQARSKLENEKPQPQKPEYPDIPPTTHAGKFINNLSYRTTIEEMGYAGQWVDEDETTLTDLNKRISEAQAHDPVKQAKTTRNLKDRVDKLFNRLNSSELAPGLPQGRA
jgi:energy-coupling factor transporter ATP-binding protein EcfA2